MIRFFCFFLLLFLLLLRLVDLLRDQLFFAPPFLRLKVLFDLVLICFWLEAGLMHIEQYFQLKLNFLWQLLLRFSCVKYQ